MKISQQMKVDLAKVAKSGVEVTINGFNEFGQEFTTKGKVMTYKGEPLIYDNGLVIDFRDESSKDKADIPSLSCQFAVDIPADQLLYGLLIVSSITLPNGQVLLNNRSANVYMKRAQQNAKETLKKIEAEGRTLEPMDPVTEVLQHFIGKPIQLDSSKPHGILLHCIRCTNSGDSIAEVCSEIKNLSASYINEETSVYATDEEGNAVVIARNSASADYDDRAEGRKVFEERAERIAAIEQAKQRNNQPQGPNN